MKTNRGKGYFYAMGARDHDLNYGYMSENFWPIWAQAAYEHGFFGVGL